MGVLIKNIQKNKIDIKNMGVYVLKSINLSKKI